jgi:uncharacterized protein YecE (DUF72 family)
MLPRTQKQAASLGKNRDQRLDNRSWLEVKKDHSLRHAIEIRHESCVCEDFITLLRRHNIALVVADTVDWPLLMDVTADFVYCRLHGSEELYASGYDGHALDIWAKRVAIWARGGEIHDGRRASTRDARVRKRRDVFVYFDNDAKVRAPFDAKGLNERVKRLME